MDITKVTKQQLFEEIEKLTKQNEKLQKQIVDQGDIAATIKLKDEAIKNEHQLRQDIKKLQDQVALNEKEKKVIIDNLQKEKNDVVTKLNELAGLLEEYIISYEDQQKILNVVLKNNNYIQSALRQKIEIFNKGEEK